MRVYVFDSEIRDGHRRKWSELVGDHVTLKWKARGLAGGEPSRGDIVVCHRVETYAQAVIEDLARNGVFIIHVSGYDSVSQKAESDNVYRRARRVTTSPNDMHFSACFKFFRMSLQEHGSPDWRLLEGPPPPDALLAYHLLCLLPGDSAAEAICNQLSNLALAEAGAIATLNPNAEPLDDLDDPVKRRAFVLACC